MLTYQVDLQKKLRRGRGSRNRLLQMMVGDIWVDFQETAAFSDFLALG